MEKIGYVSLWLGNVSTEESLTEYLELGYDEDGNWVLSSFLQDFNIGLEDFDEDFVEAIFEDKQVNDLGELLQGCSYEKIVIPRFEKIVDKTIEEKVNAAILLYNFEYTGDIKISEHGNCNFKFVGAVKYED